MKRKSFRPCRGTKTVLRPINLLKKLRWSEKHKNSTYDDWSKVLWTDKSKFQVFCQNRKSYVRHSAAEKISQCMVPTVKQGSGSIVV